MFRREVSKERGRSRECCRGFFLSWELSFKKCKVSSWLCKSDTGSYRESPSRRLTVFTVKAETVVSAFLFVSWVWTRSIDLTAILFSQSITGQTNVGVGRTLRFNSAAEVTCFCFAHWHLLCLLLAGTFLNPHLLTVNPAEDLLLSCHTRLLWTLWELYSRGSIKIQRLSLGHLFTHTPPGEFCACPEAAMGRTPQRLYSEAATLVPFFLFVIWYYAHTLFTLQNNLCSNYCATFWLITVGKRRYETELLLML